MTIRQFIEAERDPLRRLGLELLRDAGWTRESGVFISPDHQRFALLANAVGYEMRRAA